MHGDFFVSQESFTEYEQLHDTLSQALMSVAEITNLCKIVLIVLLAGYIRRGGENPVAFSLSHTIQLSNIQCAIELEQTHHRYQFSNRLSLAISVFKMLQCYLEKRTAMKESRGLSHQH